MHVGLIGSAHFGVDEPFAGGLEAHVATLSTHLAARGHTVEVLPRHRPAFVATTTARRDVSNEPDAALAAHHAYLSTMIELADSGIDVLHNHSLHHLPIVMSAAVPQPMVTTLHSPPTPWLESAYAIVGGSVGPVVSVSSANAAQWAATTGTCDVVANGVDLTRFRPGPGGGGHAAWFGRLVPEKGVESAIAAARAAGFPLRLAGPAHDPGYFDRVVRPALGPGITYEGHLDTAGLNELVGTAEVTLVTPHWDEPYGLVVAESLAMGTPVAAFARGGIPEVLGPDVGRTAPAGDVTALGDAVVSAAALDREACRRHAEDHCDVERMVDRYEELYRQALEGRPWPR